MPDTWKSHAYTISLLIASLAVRAILGVSRPSLDLSGTVIIGATTVLLLAPLLHRLFYDRNLLATRRQLTGYLMMTSVALAGFGYVVLAS